MGETLMDTQTFITILQQNKNQMHYKVTNLVNFMYTYVYFKVYFNTVYRL